MRLADHNIGSTFGRIQGAIAHPLPVRARNHTVQSANKRGRTGLRSRFCSSRRELFPPRLFNVEVGHLMARVHSGIRSPSDRQHSWAPKYEA